jgi:DNA polymerase III epsilon subunit-like protein
MSFIMVDVETDGEIPGDYSMVSFGAVVVRPGLEDTFFAELAPISDKYSEDALKISRHTREQTLAFPLASRAMSDFEQWLREKNIGSRTMFISDNNGFDFMFISWYFWHFLGRNPFGHSSTNLGSLYKGLTKDMFHSFKHLRKTKHTHHPVDDAKGNAEALLCMKENLGLHITLE